MSDVLYIWLYFRNSSDKKNTVQIVIEQKVQVPIKQVPVNKSQLVHDNLWQEAQSLIQLNTVAEHQS
jgi:hypothetical protein